MENKRFNQYVNHDVPLLNKRVACNRTYRIMSATVTDDDVILTSFPVQSPSMRNSEAADIWLAGVDHIVSLCVELRGREPTCR